MVPHRRRSWHSDAANKLGLLLQERGDLDEAASWYRTAAE